MPFRSLAHAGADVALGLRDVNAQGSLPAQIVAMGRQAIPLQMDMRHLDQIFQAVDDTVRHLGRIDILVNNAGLAPDNLAENVREEDFDLTLSVNLKGTFFASQAAGRVMIRQRSGRIINLSSQAGFVALPTESVYCMTKAAIAHLTKCLAVEWGKYNITVNAIAPTFIRTPGTESCLANPEFHSDVIERIAALHRIGDPMDVAGVVVFLASRAASLITGRDNSHRWRVDRQVSKCNRVCRDGETENEILPVLWEDNYFALLPRETRQVTATYRTGDVSKATSSGEVERWYVDPKTATVQ